jgi:hypothetical protein
MTHFDNLREHLGIMAKNFQYLANQKHLLSHNFGTWKPPCDLSHNSPRSLPHRKRRTTILALAHSTRCKPTFLNKLATSPPTPTHVEATLSTPAAAAKVKKEKDADEATACTHFIGSGSYHQGYRPAIQDFNGKRPLFTISVLSWDSFNNITEGKGFAVGVTEKRKETKFCEDADGDGRHIYSFRFR